METFVDILLRKMKTMPNIDVSTIQRQPIPSTTDNNTQPLKARQRQMPHFSFGKGKVLKPPKSKVQVNNKVEVPKKPVSVNKISNTAPKDNPSGNDTIELYKKFVDNLIKKKKDKQRKAIVEHPEYSKDTNPYPSFGKKYAGEKGVISLTSWKARINTVCITLDSLIQQCPGFHIALVLSENEFPKMCKELPESLMNLVNSEKIELLWVYKNYKSFKKVLFTMDKYRDVPVISADDDCIYTENYAEQLYNKWNDDKNLTAIRFEQGRLEQMQGPTSLYHIGNLIEKILPQLNDTIIAESEDDKQVYRMIKALNGTFGFVHKGIHKPYIFHDTTHPLHPDTLFSSMKCFKSCFR